MSIEERVTNMRVVYNFIASVRMQFLGNLSVLCDGDSFWNIERVYTHATHWKRMHAATDAEIVEDMTKQNDVLVCPYASSSGTIAVSSAECAFGIHFSNMFTEMLHIS